MSEFAFLATKGDLGEAPKDFALHRLDQSNISFTSSANYKQLNNIYVVTDGVSSERFLLPHSHKLSRMADFLKLIENTYEKNKFLGVFFSTFSMDIAAERKVIDRTRKIEFSRFIENFPTIIEDCLYKIQ